MKVRIEKDSIDLEYLKDCERSPGYALIRERQEAMLESLRTDLESAKGEDVPRIQGRIENLRTCMKLPAIIAAEIRGKQRKKDPL